MGQNEGRSRYFGCIFGLGPDLLRELRTFGCGGRGQLKVKRAATSVFLGAKACRGYSDNARPAYAITAITRHRYCRCPGQAHKAEKEKRGLMKMWEAARARLDALGGESGGSATEEEKPQSDGSGGPKAAKSERVRATKKPGSRRAGKASDGLKSQKNNPTEKDARKKEGMLGPVAVEGAATARESESPKQPKFLLL